MIYFHRDGALQHFYGYQEAVLTSLFQDYAFYAFQRACGNSYFLTGLDKWPRLDIVAGCDRMADLLDFMIGDGSQLFSLSLPGDASPT